MTRTTTTEYERTLNRVKEAGCEIVELTPNKITWYATLNLNHKTTVIFDDNGKGIDVYH